jgi:hypothetical protein
MEAPLLIRTKREMWRVIWFLFAEGAKPVEITVPNFSCSSSFVIPYVLVGTRNSHTASVGDNYCFIYLDV